MAKITILTIISAIQAIEYVLVGNAMLGVRGMYFEYWFALFAVFVFSNMLGLIISGAFDSAVTIYVMIPFLLIPQMVLGGAMFSFDKLNRKISKVGKVPLVAEFMAARWAYEALMVHQFKDNDFEKIFFPLDKAMSDANYKQVYWIPALKDHLNEAYNAWDDLQDNDPTLNTDSLKHVISDNLLTVYNEFSKELRNNKHVTFKYLDKLNLAGFNDDIYDAAMTYLDNLNSYYGQVFFNSDSKKEAIKRWMAQKDPGLYIRLRNTYMNERVSDIVRAVYDKYKILEYNHHLIRKAEPIFADPDNSHWFGFRAHFYAYRKYFMGHYFDTYWFDVFVIWFMALLLYPILYYDLLRKFIEWLGRFKIGKRLENIDLRRALKRDKRLQRKMRTKSERKKKK
jgi:hypothetical protein